FLRKIVPGGADESYGIEVAKLAGVPAPVIKRAKALQESIEANVGAHSVRPPSDTTSEPQISLSDLGQDRLTQRLREVDLNTLTPLEAMNLLYELKKTLD
ncbi:MAG: DNA mismatch repair protein MutS, partial [Oscillospiraceae bacterium]|nr:DNA mismatch repair protein MutS [Oscillospiraceae bacterium]